MRQRWANLGVAWGGPQDSLPHPSSCSHHEPAPSPAEAATETLLGDIISYYQQGAGEGRLRVRRAQQQLLGTGAPPQLYLPEDMAPPQLGTTKAQGGVGSALPNMSATNCCGH